MPTDDRLPRAHVRIIAALLVAAFVVILNETAMNVALTAIMGDLHIDERLAQWLTTAFMLTMAVVIPVTGWLVDRLPTRQVFTLSLGLFSLGTLACALAPAFPMLLGGRVIQASGTAIMMPLLMTTLMRLVPPHHRGAVMGNVSMVISVAPAVGPTVSGLLLQAGSWRLIFWAVLPIALTIGAIGLRVLTDVGETRRAPLDAASVALSALGFGGLIYGLSLVGDTHAAGWQLGAAAGVGALALAVFVARQIVLQRRDVALLDLRTFRFPLFSAAVAMMALGMMALFGTIIMLPLLLQRAFGLAPLQVGLMMLPGGVLMGVLAPLVGRLYDRVGPRWLLLPAGVVVAAVFVAFSTLNPATPWWLVMLYHATMSASFAFIFTPLFTTSLGAVPSRLYAHASAIVGTVQQVAGAAGTALFVTVFSLVSRNAEAAGAAEASALLQGAHWAFLGAGAIWTAALVMALFLRRPDDVVVEA